jgi:hypothetical protein
MPASIRGRMSLSVSACSLTLVSASSLTLALSNCHVTRPSFHLSVPRTCPQHTSPRRASVPVNQPERSSAHSSYATLSLDDLLAPVTSPSCNPPQQWRGGASTDEGVGSLLGQGAGDVGRDFVGWS